MSTPRSAVPFNIPPHVTPEGALQQPMTRRQAEDIISAFPSGPSPLADCLDWSNYGAALYLLRRDEDALQAVRTAVLIQANSMTLFNLGVVLEGYGQFTEALDCFARGHALDPGGLMAGGAYADALLRQGDWKRGWPLYSLYHSRLNVQHTPTLDELRGKRVVIIKNGKYGDNLYHLRWFKYLREAGCTIAYICDAGLIPLLTGHPWIDQLLPAPKSEGVIHWSAGGEISSVIAGTLHFNLREFDYIVSVMSLPAILGSPAPTWPGPYIHARPALRHRILPHHRLRVGLCWKAGDGGFPRAHRSLDREQLELLAGAGSHLWFVSLAQGELAPAGVATPRLRDWLDTARLIASLDLVVTVDTGIAHLAGAMGKRVWVILSGSSAWQYGLNTRLGHYYGPPLDKIYPSMHVFRNRGVGTDNSLAACVQALRDLDEL